MSTVLRVACSGRGTHPVRALAESRAGRVELESGRFIPHEWPAPAPPWTCPTCRREVRVSPARWRRLTARAREAGRDTLDVSTPGWDTLGAA